MEETTFGTLEEGPSGQISVVWGEGLWATQEMGVRRCGEELQTFGEPLECLQAR